MRQILINDDNLSLSDLDYEVTRVKGLIINSKNEILILITIILISFLEDM